MRYLLHHYYESEVGPFRNLSSLMQKEADSILSKLKQEGKVFASKRSSDYLLIRRELESTARRLFSLKGGKPTKDYPHYMTLGQCGWIREWYKDGKEIIIDLDEFNEISVSFSYGDLFPTMRYKDGKEYRETIYTKSEIIEIIEKYGLPQEWNHDGSKGPERYIEVQIWDDEVISKYL